MKNLFLLGLLIISAQAFGQKKVEIEKQAATIDTLTQQNASLMAELDSLKSVSDSLSQALQTASEGLDLYYTTIKEKVLIHDFDPATLPEIIDSLKNSRDEKITSLSTTSASQTDSIIFLSTMVTSLQDSLASLEKADSNRDKLVAELKQLKELLDSGIFTQEEYDAKKAEIMSKW